MCSRRKHWRARHAHWLHDGHVSSHRLHHGAIGGWTWFHARKRQISRSNVRVTTRKSSNNDVSDFNGLHTGVKLCAPRPKDEPTNKTGTSNHQPPSLRYQTTGPQTVVISMEHVGGMRSISPLNPLHGGAPLPLKGSLPPDLPLSMRAIGPRSRLLARRRWTHMRAVKQTTIMLKKRPKWRSRFLKQCQSVFRNNSVYLPWPPDWRALSRVLSKEPRSLPLVRSLSSLPQSLSRDEPRPRSLWFLSRESSRPRSLVSRPLVPASRSLPLDRSRSSLLRPLSLDLDLLLLAPPARSRDLLLLLGSQFHVAAT